ncbi:helix-turn-helix domain-containing protein [Thioclava sp. GXIMD2076]|uniref:helix-turn-helix domain-containing protein n=1 Tax=Thioclava sp. GXIMD2076 TaxID=3131931 RepID=UPI0030CDCD44
MTDNVTDMPLSKLTPQQAANKASVSRGTIMNAIKDGSLIAMRDNRNRWQITTDNLSKWLSDRSDNASGTIRNPLSETDTKETSQPTEHAIRIAVLEAELNARDQRIEDLKEAHAERVLALERDRDAWKDQAQSLAKRPRRWWPF